MNRLILETAPPINYEITVEDKIQRAVIGIASFFILSQIIIILTKVV